MAGMWWTLHQTGAAPGAYSLTASTGSFILTGQDAALKTARTLASSTGTFTLTGQDVTFRKGYSVSAEVGTFTLTGQAASFLRTYQISTTAGPFTVLGNNYSAESNLQALYKFESGALTTDSSGKSNTLTAYSAPDESIADRREGLCAADFELSNSDGLYRADADLNADFPLKYGTSNKIFTICGWTKIESLAHGSHADIVSKTYDGSGLESLRLAWYRWNDEYRIYLTLGRAEAPGYESILLFTVTSAECIGVWAHIAATYDDSTKAWTARMWDANTNTAASNSGTATNNILLTQARLGIGCASWGTSWSVGLDGIVDEVAIFNRVLTTAEIDSIRIQTFGSLTNLKKDLKISSATGTFTLTGQDIAFSRTYVADADTGAFTLSGQDVAFSRTYILPSSTGTFTFTGIAATLTYTPVGAYSLSVDTGTFTLTGQAVNLLTARVLTSSVGTFTLTGQAASFLRAYINSASTGTFTLSGQDVAFTRTYTLPLSTGTFTLTGYDATLTYSPVGVYTLSVDTGTFTLTGQAVGLRADHTLSLSTGTFTLSGQAVNLYFGYGFSASSGTFALTGYDASFVRTYNLPLSTGTFIFTGQDVNLVSVNGISASTGIFVLSGQSVTFSVPRTLSASPGVFILTGRPVLLDYSGRVICVKYLDSIITDPMLLDSLITEEITLDGDLCR